MKKFIAFTLSEILIALGVIGVIASLIIPQIIVGHKAATAKAQFETGYNMLYSAFTNMEADGIHITPLAFSTTGSIYRILKNYNKIIVDCGGYHDPVKNIDVCIDYGAHDKSGAGDNYKIYKRNSNVKMNLARLDDGAFVLNNGMLIAIENPGPDDEKYTWISIDINGKNKLPNRWGWDLFSFEITNEGLFPLGAAGTTEKYSKKPKDFCNHNSDNFENGATCAYYALTDNDYFKKLYRGF